MKISKYKKYLIIASISAFVAVIINFRFSLLVAVVGVIIAKNWSHDGSGQFDLSDEIELAIITGLAFTIIFSMVSPVVVNIEKELAPTPKPDIETPTVEEYHRINNSHIAVPIMVINVQNPSQKSLSNIMLTADFCGDMVIPNYRLHSPYQTGESNIDTRESYDNNYCQTFIEMSSLPGNRSTRIAVMEVMNYSRSDIWGSKLNSSDNMCIESDTGWGEVGAVYSWGYKGRKFTEELFNPNSNLEKNINFELVERSPSCDYVLDGPGE